MSGRISSARVVANRPVVTGAPPPGRPEGGRAVLYAQPGLAGRGVMIDRAIVRDLREYNFNDRAQSLRVESGYWIFCSDADFEGDCRTFGPGDYPDLLRCAAIAASLRAAHLARLSVQRCADLGPRPALSEADGAVPAIVDDIAGFAASCARARTIAVVGLSANWYRPSYFAAKYMQEHGYRIIPVNPRYAEVLGERCYPDAAHDPGAGRHRRLLPPAAEMSGRSPSRRSRSARRCLWMQIGISNEAAARSSRAPPASTS